MSLFNLKKKGKAGETSLPPMPGLSTEGNLDLPPMPPSRQDELTLDSGLPEMPSLPGASAVPEPDSNIESNSVDLSVLKETELEFPDVAKFELPNLPDLKLELDSVTDTSSSDDLSLPDLGDTLDLGILDSEPDVSDDKLPDLDNLSSTENLDAIPEVAQSTFNEGPLFVKVDTFKDVIEVIDISRDELADSLTLGDNILETFNKETLDIDKFKTLLFDVNKKLYQVEEILFCR